MEGISYIHSWEGIAEKRQKILELSQKTISYQFWISAQKEVKPVFDAFVRQQPEEIQTMLRNYVGICQMLLQREVITACGYMDFLDPCLKEQTFAD